MGNISTLGYIHSEKLVKWVIIFIYIQAIAAVLGMTSAYLEFSLLQDYMSDAFQSEAAAKAAGDANDLRQTIVCWTQAVIYFVTAVLVLKWIYRANYDAHELGATNMTFSPAMAVIWFFVPVMNLWKPYHAMMQLWKASYEPINWKSAKGHPVVGIWWAFWLAMVTMGFTSLVMAHKASDLSSASIASVVEVLSDLMTLLATLAMLMLVKRIHVAQLKFVEHEQA